MTTKARRDYSEIIVIASLIVVTFAVYWQTKDHDFIVYDDLAFIVQNPHIQSGLNWKAVKWSFTDMKVDYWHPLTWLSHALDIQLYGLNAAGHHMTNVILHITNAVLLFLLLKRMTGALWRSAFIAAVFALHPLNVESVAWAAERKSVLSVLFFILTIRAYVDYAEHPSAGRYVITLLLFALGLMSKPVLVTLPFILLLLDYWPLDRFGTLKPPYIDEVSGGRAPMSWKAVARRLVLEKIPFFALSLSAGFLTVIAHKSIGVVTSLEQAPVTARLSNALTSYVIYLKMMVWPHKLSIFYPYVVDIMTPWKGAAAGIFVAGIFALVIINARRHRYLAVGWLWYFVALLPMIGLLHVGGQAMADRFTYIPLIGVFLIIAWGWEQLVSMLRYNRIVSCVAAALVLPALALGTSSQLRHWQNSAALFEHAVTVTDNNYVAHTNLGSILLDEGRYEEALDHFSKAVSVNPGNAITNYNMGYILTLLRRCVEARPFFLKSLEINPQCAEAHNFIGECLSGRREYAGAISQYREALKIRPGYPHFLNNLAIALAGQGKYDDAVSVYSESLHITFQPEAKKKLKASLEKAAKASDQEIVGFDKAGKKSIE